MDVPFFLLQQQPERPRRSSCCRSGSGPFRRQSHRPTDYYPVTVSPLSPKAIPERLKDAPGTVTRVPARSAGTPQEPRILSIAPGKCEARPLRNAHLGVPRHIAADQRQTLHRCVRSVAKCQPQPRGPPLAFWYEALLDGTDAAQGVRCNSAARGSFRPWLRPVDSPTGEYIFSISNIPIPSIYQPPPHSR